VAARACRGTGRSGPLQAGRYRAEVFAAGRAVQARFKPVKLYYLALGNAVPHLHAHILPGTRTIQPRAGPIAWEAGPAETSVSDSR